MRTVVTRATIAVKNIVYFTYKLFKTLASKAANKKPLDAQKQKAPLVRGFGLNIKRGLQTRI
jgi:hypothetical protein